MTARRAIALLLALMLLFSAAAEEIAPEETPMPAEEVHAFVELLFAAAAGAGEEAQPQTDMTQEEIDAWLVGRADYRAKTLPWLIAAFQPEENTPQPTPEPTPGPTLSPDVPPVYTEEDGYAAFAQTQQGREYLAALAQMGATGWEDGLSLTRKICELWMAEVDHAALIEMNGDYRCWIYAPGTQIDYPVVQCGDNSHYLKRMFNGARNSAGTLFIDYRNLPDFQDPNTLVYGHHMRNDSMFGSLTDYVRQAYFEAHPFMLFASQKETFLLELFAGYTTSDKDHCYDIAISGEEDMLAFIQEAERKSDFISGVAVKATDRLVTLSTCAYAFEDARYILIGRIVPVRALPAENGGMYEYE